MEQKIILLRALLIKGAVATLTASLTALVFFSPYEAAGIIIGGAIGILNFVILIRFVYSIIYPESGGRGIIIFLSTAKLLFLFLIFLAIIKWQIVSILGVFAGFTIILIVLAYEGLRQARA